ncbi:MAG: hypothetical protein ACR2PK_15355 [Acidimicrobiales bacterium]
MFIGDLIAADEEDRLTGPLLGRFRGGLRLEVVVRQGAGVKMAVTLGELTPLGSPLSLLQTR